jgi:HlyD family secretion protein
MNSKYRVFAVLGLVSLISLGVYFWTRPGGEYVVLIGTVDANQVIVSSKVSGRIERLLVDEGQAVKHGALIAQIDDADLKARRDAAQAQLDSLRAQVRQSQESYASTRGETGANVANAEASLRAAQAALEESEAQERQQELDTRRIVALAEAGVASQQDRDRAEQTLAADQARVRANRNQVHAAQATLETMKARLSQASAAQANVAATQEQMDAAKANLEQAEVQLGYAQIVAPVNGIVSVRAAREGEVVNPTTPIVTLVDLTDTWVYAAIPETQAQAVKLGDTLQVRMPGGETISGEVIAKATEAGFATERDYSRTKRDIRTVRLKLRIANPREIYVPGMTAEVLLPRRLFEGTQGGGK